MFDSLQEYANDLPELFMTEVNRLLSADETKTAHRRLNLTYKVALENLSNRFVSGDESIMEDNDYIYISLL